MNKLFSTLMITVLLFSGLAITSCSNTNEQSKSESQTSSLDPMLDNPTQVYATKTALETAVGYKVDFDTSKFTKIRYSKIGTIAQINLTYKDSTYVVRATNSTDANDISGDSRVFGFFDLVSHQKVNYAKGSNAKVVFYAPKHQLTYSITATKYNKDNFKVVLDTALDNN